jgi:hypothetical protein
MAKVCFHRVLIEVTRKVIGGKSSVVSGKIIILRAPPGSTAKAQAPDSLTGITPHYETNLCFTRMNKNRIALNGVQ